MATTHSNVLLLRPKEVANVLNISVAELREWRENSIGPRFTRLGRKILYWRIDVAEVMVKGPHAVPHPARPMGRTKP